MSGEPSRVVLQGVPRVSFQVAAGHDAETVPFPSCLRACLEYLGEGMGQTTVIFRDAPYLQNTTYTYLMGVSGAAFRLVWRPGWHLDNSDLTLMAEDPMEPYHRAFDAVGYDFEVVRGSSEAAFRRAIKTQIRDMRHPVLAFGVIGPPECCLITGYDDEGDVLIGWNFFQEMPPFNTGIEYEATGEYRKREWFPATQALVLVTDRKPRPPSREIYHRALDWALTVIRAAEIRGRCTGLAAYGAWAAQLCHDADFTADDLAAIRERHSVHHDAIGTVAEGRWYAACFLQRAAEDEPDVAAELLAAAECYVAEHDVMWEIWNLMGGLGFDETNVRRFAQPDVRRDTIALIHTAQTLDAEAAAHVEHALNALI